jgi:hypothetical protein
LDSGVSELETIFSIAVPGVGLGGGDCITTG